MTAALYGTVTFAPTKPFSASEPTVSSRSSSSTGMRHVLEVELERLEGGVLHAGRERVRDGVSEEPDEAQHCSPPRGYASNSAELAVKKWLLQSALRMK